MTETELEQLRPGIEAYIAFNEVRLADTQARMKDLMNEHETILINLVEARLMLVPEVEETQG